MEDTPMPGDDTTVHELVLLQRADLDAARGGDPTLLELHRRIRLRRTRRSAVELARAAVPARGAPPDAAPGPVDPGPGHEAPGREQTDPEPSVRGAPGRILAIEPFGPTVRVLRIGRPAGFDFRPGQYLKLGVPGGKREDFSIASAPHDPHLALAIELRPGGTVTPALFALGVGDAVDIGGAAKGKLQLDRVAADHLMVATVTGIAPLRSMVHDALRAGSTARFTILHGASHAAELPFHDELVSLAAQHDRVRYVPTVSRPEEAANRSWTGSAGRVDPLARLAASGLGPATTHVYAVGNAGMIEAVVRDLGGAGFTVSTESYGG